MNFAIVSFAFLGSNQAYQSIKLGPRDLAGGAEVYLYDLAELLIRLGHSVTIIQIGDRASEFDFHGIRVKTIPTRGILRRLGLPEQWFEFNLAWKKALPTDTNHVHLHYFQHAFPGAERGMTATSHGVTWDMPPKEANRYGREMSGSPSSFVLPLLHRSYLIGERFLARYAVKHLMRIAANDTFFLRWVQSELPDYREKVVLLPNYVDTTVFHPGVSGTELRKRFGDRPVLLFPRNISFSRGIQFVVEALPTIRRKYSDVLVVVVGDGTARPYLERKILELGLGENILIEGHKDHWGDLPHYYASADIVLIPTSHFEGTSLSCLEAMACGKPVIATNVGGLPDLVQDKVTGRLIRPSAEELAESVCALLGDSAFRRKLGRASVKVVSERFSKAIWEQRYQDFFELGNSAR